MIEGQPSGKSQNNEQLTNSAVNDARHSQNNSIILRNILQETNRKSTLTDGSRSLQINENIDLQYIYQVKELINMLKTDQSNKIYVNQVHVYLTNHRNYVKEKQKLKSTHGSKPASPAISFKSITEGYQKLQAIFKNKEKNENSYL